MTTQLIFNAQTFGTSTNVGNNKFSISPLTLSATTTAYVVSIKTVLGTNESLSTGKVVRVYYTTSTYTVVDIDAPYHLGPTARYVDIDLARSTTTIRDSSLEPATGANFYAWAAVPNLSAAATLTATLVELP